MGKRSRQLIAVWFGLAATVAGATATFALFTDSAVITVSAGAGQWASTAPPPECTAMTFDNVIVGTSGNDVLHGTVDADLVFGYSGDDVLYGGDGEDCLVGGPGHDILYGENGVDVLIGGPETDTCTGGDAPDAVDCEVSDETP